VVRLIAALMLPALVPGIITGLIWALPGDPASLICPPSVCGGTEALARRWNLDGGAIQFFIGWALDAMRGDFGNSWRLFQGMRVSELVGDAIPNTIALVALSTLLISTGVTGAATGWLSPRFDPLLRAAGMIPALVLALVGAASVELMYGFDSFTGAGKMARLLVGAGVLGLADGAFTGAVTGTRGLFSREQQQRYVGVAILRGERALHNTLPNVAPALIGQFRARILHLLSGAVVVEVILRIDGIGDLLWGGTLKQDFGVVLATATVFACFSGALLLAQAIGEIVVALHVRRSPSVHA
jgi:peptide/nickel transport system permease protein